MAKAFPTQAVGSGSAPAKTSTDSNQLTYAGGRIPVTAGQQTVGALFGTVVVPKGAEMARVTVSAPTGVTVEVGDAGDTDRLLAATAAATAPVSGIATTGFGYQYPAETLISVRIATATAAVNGTIVYSVEYVSQ